VFAIPAVSINAAHPRHANTCACHKFGRAGVCNFSNNLVSWNYFFAVRRQLAFHNVQVSPANAARANPEQNLAALELWFKHVTNFKRALRNIAR
jgi:hypothetical protein